MGIAACGDPPLLATPLPNGYDFNSNGGEFGYITRPDGTRMAEYFGILNNGEEQWCGPFGWEGKFVVCEVVEYVNNSLETKNKGYFLLNSQTGEAAIFSSEKEIINYWKVHLRVPFPRLAHSYPATAVR
jgi:hypothetical protein